MPKKIYSAYDFQKIALQNIVIQTSASDPSSPVAGQLYFNTGTGRYRFYTGSVWYEINTPTSLPPSGAASGELAGSYPNPTVADGVIDAANMTTATRGPGTLYGGTAVDTYPALRALGIGAGYALSGQIQLGTLSTANPTASNVDFNAKRSVNLSDPINPTDGATKQYVDAAIQGMSVKTAVRASPQTSINIASVATSWTMDGVTMNPGDRVLLQNQSDARENGIYVMVGASASALTITRSADADTGAELQGAFVFVSEGAQNGNVGFYQISDAITLGTTVIVWTQFSAVGKYSAGNALFLNGVQFNVNYDNTTIGLTGNNLQVKDLGITTAKLADGAVSLSGTKVSGALPVANGGTGSGGAAGARQNLQVPIVQAIYNPALTAGTWATATFPAAFTQTTYPSITVYDATTFEQVDIEVKTGINFTQVQLRADVAVAASALLLEGIG